MQGCIIVKFAEQMKEDPDKIENCGWALRMARWDALDYIRQLLGRSGQKMKIVNASSMDNALPAPAEDLTFADLIPDNRDDYAESMVRMDLERALMKIEASQPERVIITFRMFDELTQEKVGEIMGISASRVSQIEKRVKYKLQRAGFDYATQDFRKVIA